jgi:hypothetical protein
MIADCLLIIVIAVGTALLGEGAWNFYHLYCVF